MFLYKIVSVIVIINVILPNVLTDGNYYLKAAKNVPRIGRSSKQSSNIDEMGKFFMKASKSVPRIGRRNENFEYAVERRDQQVPHWADIAERFEYNPEMFINPEVLEQMEMGDDPSTYDSKQVRNKRAAHPKFYLF